MSQGGGKEAADRGQFTTTSAGLPPTRSMGDLAMEHQTYAVVDIVALTLAAALAATIVVIGFHLMHELADLPPALSGSP
jgi:hypothetical protein